MEIILLKPHRKLGTIGNLCMVANGFARNFLIPNGIALRATTRNKRFFEERKHELELQNADDLTKAQILSEKIQGTKLVFIRQSSDDGKLFGSISLKEIIAEINTKFNLTLKRTQVILDQPIKIIGVLPVKIALHHDVHAEIIVNVARSQAEAAVAINTYSAAISAATSTNTASEANISADIASVPSADNLDSAAV